MEKNSRDCKLLLEEDLNGIDKRLQQQEIKMAVKDGKNLINSNNKSNSNKNDKDMGETSNYEQKHGGKHSRHRH